MSSVSDGHDDPELAGCIALIVAAALLARAMRQPRSRVKLVGFALIALGGAVAGYLGLGRKVPEPSQVVA
jgi:hypothetical protein